MKKFKRFASLLLSAAMVTCMVGCGGGNEPPQRGDNTLLLGGIGPLTGQYASYGISTRNGAKIAVDEINAAGGVNGFTLAFDYHDSQADPSSAVSAYGKLMDMGMDISLGATVSGETQSVVAAAKEDGIFLLTPTATSRDCLKGNDLAFRVCFNDPQQGYASADYIMENKLGTKVAVFYASDVDYSVGIYETFEAHAKELGLEVVEVQTFTESTNTDFSTQISAIKASGCDLVFLPIYAAEAANFLTQAEGKLSDVVFFGCDGLDGILTKISDPALVEGVLMLTPFAAQSTEGKVPDFVETYKSLHNTLPDQFAADGYDAVYAIKAALEKAGITPGDHENMGERLAKAMTEITVEGITGKMTWTADGETAKAAKAMVFKNGSTELFGTEG